MELERSTSAPEHAETVAVQEEPRAIDWDTELEGSRNGLKLVVDVLSKLQDNQRKKLQTKRTVKDKRKLELAFCEYREVQKQIGRCLYLMKGRASDLGIEIQKE